MGNLTQAVNNGIYMPNEAREYLDIPWAEGGDRLIVNGNYIPLTDVGKQWDKGGEENANTTVQEPEPAAGQHGNPEPDGDNG